MIVIACAGHALEGPALAALVRFQVNAQGS
jgi:hypothetical protein